MKNKLIGSAASPEQLLGLLEKYFYSKCSLVPQTETTFDVHNSTKKIEGFVVVKKGKRFRFELIVDETF